MLNTGDDLYRSTAKTANLDLAEVVLKIVEVRLAWRQLPSPLHDEPVYRANVIKCRQLIAAREGAGAIINDASFGICHIQAVQSRRF